MFECERALDLLARHEDWAWTNDVLVRKHLWPILQQWGSEKGDDSQGDLVQSVLRLVGKFDGHSGTWLAMYCVPSLMFSMDARQGPK